VPISARVLKSTPTISGWVHKIHPTLFEKAPTKAHYDELSKFRDFVGQNKASLWMGKVLFWTSMGAISSHYNAFSFLDPNFRVCSGGSPFSLFFSLNGGTSGH
jgi:hypothetical protein